MTEKKKVARTVTSIKIDPQIWKEAKKSAIDHDFDVSEIVQKALGHWINVESAKMLREKNK